MSEWEILQPRVGARVRARGRTWLVTGVDTFTDCRVVTLSAVGASTVSRRLVVPFDDVDVDARDDRPTRVGLARWRRAWRALVATQADATSLRCTAAARIDLLPYQLEPALALLRARGSRLLIADEVGLGKTIQALVAVAELHARGLASRVLVVCPAGLRDQWVDEWRDRFGLTFVGMDHAAQRRIRGTLPYGMNPWRAEPLVVTSVDYVKRADVLPSALSAGWDVVVVDEAHGACGVSERHAAVSHLCHRASWVILLSATPHSGDDAAFHALYTLGRHEHARADERLVVFRRSRLEAGRDAGRKVHTLRVTGTTAERRMHVALAALTRAIRRDSPEFERHTWLILSLLHKRALSSAYALAASVERRLQLLDRPSDASALQLALPLDDESGELDGIDAAPMWGEPAMHDVARERRLLEGLLDAAHQATGDEGKLHRLHKLLRRVREPVIVFTEYRDTLLHLRQQVAPTAAVVHGGMTRDQRREALAAFANGGVLLATDAAGEGLNLQHHCRTVVNLELPWNPMRLEQRIGRVDRIGQRGRVHVMHLVADGTAECRLLTRLSTRVSQAHARIGAPDPLSGRPAWTEDASARLVVLNADPPPAPPPDAHRPVVPLTRLEHEGVAESQRIDALRAWTQAPGTESAVAVPLANAGTLVATSRRSRTRRALAGRVVACCQTTASSAAGHTVAAHVFGLAVPADALGPAPQRIARLLAAASTADESTTWARTAFDEHEQLMQVYEQRLAGVLALLGRPVGEQQPGLFDRRVAAAGERFEDERREARADLLERLARCQRLRQPGGVSTSVVLLLEPRGASR